jgi:Mg2+ and Co2+ transporter CorA
VSLQPGLIWGFELLPGEVKATEDCSVRQAGCFRWLHVSLAHQGTIDWIAHAEILPSAIKEMLLSTDSHQRSVIEDGVISCVLHDFERDFERADTSRVGTLHFALTPTAMITARLHPVRSADLMRDKLAHGAAVFEPAAALDLLVCTIAEGMAATTREIGVAVQQAEEDFLDDHDPPTARHLIGIRRRLVQVHRLLADMRNIFHRLEDDEDLPAPLQATVKKLAQRLHSLDTDALEIHGQIRLLREEIDMQADQRTNQNLYILSILTALMLPATLVTGLFGMNTGGMPWGASAHGTLTATLLAFGAAGGSYVLLRWLGFMRR